MDNRPIGIFDSGLGGLTGLMALRELLPEENLIYFGDTGRLPYGGRPASQLKNKEKAFGVLRAGVEGMARVPGDGPLAVIATQASIDSGAFARALAERCPGREILPVPCPAFVPLIEGGHTRPGDPELEQALERYLRPVKEAGAQALLYGCTHYGIIDEAVRTYLGPAVQTVSASACAAQELADFLLRENRCGGSGEERYFTNGDPIAFAESAERLLGHALPAAVEKTAVLEC